MKTYSFYEFITVINSIYKNNSLFDRNIYFDDLFKHFKEEEIGFAQFLTFMVDIHMIFTRKARMNLMFKRKSKLVYTSNNKTRYDSILIKDRLEV